MYRYFDISLRLFDKINYSFYSERLSLDLVILFYLNLGELASEVSRKLTCVQLADNHAFVSSQHFAGVLRKRADIVEMRQVAP